MCVGRKALLLEQRPLHRAPEELRAGAAEAAQRDDALTAVDLRPVELRRGQGDDQLPLSRVGTHRLLQLELGMDHSRPRLRGLLACGGSLVGAVTGAEPQCHACGQRDPRGRGRDEHAGVPHDATLIVGGPYAIAPASARDP